MSNPVRYDTILVHYLARELEQALSGERVELLRLAPAERRAALETGRGALVLDLHPTRGWIHPGAAPPAAELVRAPRRSAVAAVTTPADERLIEIRLEGGRGGAGRMTVIVIELLANQWNVVALDATGRIVGVLWRRRAGTRELRPGAEYSRPVAAERAGVEAPIGVEEWRQCLGEVAPAERAGVLVREIAWTSPLNAGPILGAAAERWGVAELDAAHARYAAIASRPAATPRLLLLPGGAQPYPLPLPGVPDRPVEGLLAAMAELAGVTAAQPAVAVRAASPEALARLRSAVERQDARLKRLQQELAGAAPQAAGLRQRGDLLLAHLGQVPRGAAQVELPDFEGGTTVIELDPALAPAENARRYYDAARRREHAAERLPGLIEAVQVERERLAELLDRAERGAAAAEEVEAAVPATAGSGRDRQAAAPFRRYRTSGGLEVRVGRSRSTNDELTFHHSAPNDIWLHARDVGGAHVVLRWPDASAHPPARDLTEAAVLAALHSRARTSGLVAVDWTRRKYVRKPRKSPPGLVVLERAKTLFVEPDAALERRLRERGEDSTSHDAEPEGASD